MELLSETEEKVKLKRSQVRVGLGRKKMLTSCLFYIHKLSKTKAQTLSIKRVPIQYYICQIIRKNDDFVKSKSIFQVV